VSTAAVAPSDCSNPSVDSPSAIRYGRASSSPPCNPPGSPQMPNQWYCNCSGKNFGPFNDAQLRQLAAGGQLKPTDLVWKDGMRVWEPASKLRGLFPPPAPMAIPVPVASVAPPAPVAYRPVTASGRCWYCRLPRPHRSVQCPYCRQLRR
jgi:hypothetical protein